MTRHENPNRQRDHQANERTFLAWVRTAVALIAFGFAIARFGLITRQLESALTNQSPITHSGISSQNLGLILVIFGIFSILVAALRYNKVYRQIERGDYRPERFVIWVITAIVTLLGILSIPLLMINYPDASSKTSPLNPQKLP